MLRWLVSFSWMRWRYLRTMWSEGSCCRCHRLHCCHGWKDKLIRELICRTVSNFFLFLQTTNWSLSLLNNNMTQLCMLVCLFHCELICMCEASLMNKKRHCLWNTWNFSLTAFTVIVVQCHFYVFTYIIDDIEDLIIYFIISSLCGWWQNMRNPTVLVKSEPYTNLVYKELLGCRKCLKFSG